MMIFDGFGPPFGVPGGALWGSFWRMFCEMDPFKQSVRVICRTLKKSENGGPQGGVDMQSAHACACFVRVGRCGLDSILGSILGSFWEPSSPLYSFLVALGAWVGIISRFRFR